MENTTSFNEDDVLHKLSHYLPAQAPLKDFIHHNTLHAFQHEKFEVGIRRASKIFGYKVSLSVDEFRELYKSKKIKEAVLDRTIQARKGEHSLDLWKERALSKAYDSNIQARIGQVRKHWKSDYHIDLDTIVHTNIFRIINSYLDQGIAITRFPVQHIGFLDALRTLESNSYVSFFKTKGARNMLFDESVTIGQLLDRLVGDEALYEQYLFDQQFAHPGWSGLVSVIENLPDSLLDKRKITLKEFITLELILEIDNLDQTFSRKWLPLAKKAKIQATELFGPTPNNELDDVLNIWQEAYEQSYYDEVLAGVHAQNNLNYVTESPIFQAFFCIDDRECSIRRYVEQVDPRCDTFGTPGHFAIDTYYQPYNGKFYTKVCPTPISPKHLIKELSPFRRETRDLHFDKQSHGLFRGWLISQSLGFWSAFKLALNIFKPSLGPASTSSFRHMDKFSSLIVENQSPNHKHDHLQIGYTIEEMTDRVEAVLKSTGLVKGFAPIVYMIGHGASSANNTHYAGYDCGACSGRPGSVNARAFSYMANHRGVRERLKLRGIDLPIETEFLGGLHDTTADEIVFYDEEKMSPENQALHVKNIATFEKALDLNAKERSRRFMSVDSRKDAKKVHESIRRRSVSLFEPRPELNHATNTLCLIGRRWLNRKLFLDRRAFLNSYDYKVDPDGRFLLNILNAAAPVCGGINLEYFFSRVDNEKLGAGTKLPHNVMGLIGVANGFEGDLRPGLPLQMIEVHDPVRLLMIVEHFPEVVMKTIKANPATYEWFINEWVSLAVVHPESKEIVSFKDGEFIPYEATMTDIPEVSDLDLLIESNIDNFPVFQLK